MDKSKYDIMALKEARIAITFRDWATSLRKFLVIVIMYLMKIILINKPIDTIKHDNYELMTFMFNLDFSVGSLTQHQIDRLNTYHDSYIKKNILSQIANSVVDEKSVLFKDMVVSLK